MIGDLRVVAVWCSGEGQPPPGVDVTAWRKALVADCLELAADLAEVRPALAVLAGHPVASELATAVAWPGLPVIEVYGDTVGLAIGEIAMWPGWTREVTDVALISGDAPDLPGLLVGKLFSALDSAEVAACPAAGGGLAAFAGRARPAGHWLNCPVWLDDPDALQQLQAVPEGRVAVVPGWHRLRRPEDVAHLDPGLEGWESTRSLLSAPR